MNERKQQHENPKCMEKKQQQQQQCVRQREDKGKAKSKEKFTRVQKKKGEQ